jgi:membrane-associated phospholipid phosphatase
VSAIIGAIVWWRIGKLEAILIPVTGLLTFVNTALKLVINHSRPEVIMVLNSPASAAFGPVSEHPNNGFPSGHAFFAIILLGLLAYYIFITEKKPAVRVPALIGLIILILLVGISRIYMGKHWLSDVLGGYLIGGIFLTVLIWFHQTRKSQR